jgi:hypothetical protein
MDLPAGAVVDDVAAAGLQVATPGSRRLTKRIPVGVRRLEACLVWQTVGEVVY